jgi:5-deoxy-glucuronate isomerase
VEITSLEDSFFYIAGAPYENIGEVSFRKYDPTLPIGDVHQIHGEGVGRREVMCHPCPQDPRFQADLRPDMGRQRRMDKLAAHQHEKDLEEVYCYFDMPPPNSAFI